MSSVKFGVKYSVVQVASSSCACVVFFWCLLAISFSLGTDGMLLALCDHGFERSG